MTDTAKVTVSFTQKVSEAPYETADYSLSIERSVPESMGDDGILAEASSMFEQVTVSYTHLTLPTILLV